MNNEQRFHVSFKYTNPEKGWENTGSQVVMAESIEQAAERIIRDRSDCGLRMVTINRRFHQNGRIDEINRTFAI